MDRGNVLIAAVAIASLMVWVVAAVGSVDDAPPEAWEFQLEDGTRCVGFGRGGVDCDWQCPRPLVEGTYWTPLDDCIMPTLDIADTDHDTLENVPCESECG